jgi:glycosyltransferase involved in cell wall biosynthesis
MKQSLLGVSVIICCHNSARVLCATLEHLKAQQVPREIDWEVIVVDNASTDDTTKTALSCWHDDSPVPLRLVSEPRIGLTNARMCGFRVAKYEVISFVDDDNWVAPDWVAQVSEIMSVNPDLGAVGSFNEPVAECVPPDWFDDYAWYYYAIVRECDVASGRISLPPTTLTGAGMSIRKKAWQQLIAHGFVPYATDRVGKKLSGCGDRELTLVIYLSGWQLDIDRRLRLKHFMPAPRLQWRYLRRLARGTAASLLTMRTYEPALPGYSREAWIKETWPWQVMRVARFFFSRPALLRAWLFSANEGDRNVIDAERQIGTIIGLLQLRGLYNFRRRVVRTARWKKDSCIEVVSEPERKAQTAVPQITP